MSIAKTAFFMTLMTVFVVFVGHLFDLYFGGGHLYLGLFLPDFAIGMNFFSYWFADTIVLKMHRARVVTPEEAPGLHRHGR
jgi:heat shock protein HtpX